MKLAIEGHSTQGSEVIARLKMLGGMNTFNLNGSETNCYYYIDNNNRIYHCLGIDPRNYIYYTLEEFLEKFPYKVGDKVTVEHYKGIWEIIELLWSENLNIIYYGISNGKTKELVRVEEIKPYKEEIMEEPKELLIGFTKDDEGDWILNTHKNYEIKEVDGKFKLIKKKPKYPKTYAECCKIVNASIFVRLVYNLTDGEEYSHDVDNLKIYDNIRRLKICRDAYWKIAGEQMGLGKPWEPDWNDCAQHKFGLYTLENEIRCINLQVLKNIILVFPTEEMRDTFYENFKDLIEQCKELL